MTLDDYNRFCRSLPQATHVVQWGGAHVWKVGGKVFAIGGWNDAEEELFVTFKCSAMSYDMLKEMRGCRPAPYLASRGMTWIQRTSNAELSDTGLKDYLRASYDLVVTGLSKRAREQMALADTAKLIKTNSKAAASPSRTKPATKSKTTPILARAKPRKGVRP